LFARANSARRSGDQEQATSLYRALIERYRSSSEAHEAEAVLGRTRLDSSDPGDALRYFDDYLDTDGALREDVMSDRAAALQGLGRADEEASAWTALLQDYPASVHGERARKRLSELGKR
jgi:outer membrane protein assembly factor BamD (BamD/ComL family)